MRHLELHTICAVLIVALIGCGGANGDGRSSAPPDSADRSSQPARGTDAQAPSGMPAPTTGARDAGSPPQQTGSDRQDPGSLLTGDVSNLQGLVEELHGTITDREILIELPADVLFDFDRADIRPEAIPTLQTLSDLIERAGDGTIHINGHTDSVGTAAYNRGLSDRRAAAVVLWLTSRGGVDAARIEARGAGESQPVASNVQPDGSDNPEGRQKNRRVEVRIPR